MNSLKEAVNLVVNTTGFTAANLQKLAALKDQAQGDEAAIIGKLIAVFTGEAPPTVLDQIMKRLQ